MAFHSRVMVAIADTGTGVVHPGSALSGGFNDFSTGSVADGENVSYVIEDDNGAWETGTGTYTSATNILARSVLKSSNSNALISLSGSARLYLTPVEDAGILRLTGSAGVDQKLYIGGYTTDLSFKVNQAAGDNIIQAQVVTPQTLGNNPSFAIAAFGSGVTPRMAFGTSNHATVGSHTALASGRNMGQIDFYGSDGTRFLRGALIQGQTNGSAAFTNGWPSKLNIQVGRATDGTLTTGLSVRAAGPTVPSTTVANLLSASGADAGAGTIAYASNGRKSGEGSGAGTGVPVWSDGTNWRTFYDNSVVAA
jgi:hypothetical protein